MENSEGVLPPEQDNPAPTLGSIRRRLVVTAGVLGTKCSWSLVGGARDAQAASTEDDPRSRPLLLRPASSRPGLALGSTTDQLPQSGKLLNRSKPHLPHVSGGLRMGCQVTSEEQS